MTPAKAPLPFLGTWNFTKCETSHPDLPYPVAGITTFAEEDGLIHYSAETTWSDGRTSSAQAVLRLDGSWCPITGSQLADTISISPTADGLSVRIRKAGADIGTTSSKVSPDGRTMNGGWELAGPGGVAITWKTTSTRA